MLKVELPSVDATERLGRALAAVLEPPMLVTLAGELGTGKTTLVRHIMRSRGVTDEVVSPSFTLAQSYRDQDGLLLHHLDLYRLAPGADSDLFAWDDYLAVDAIVFVEWPEAGYGVLPSPDVAVEFDHVAPGERAARVTASTEIELALTGALREQRLEAVPHEPAPESTHGRRVAARRRGGAP
jgi:tRNA threonylcarbamoyladenosine biosynthesis protein TsaE